MKFSLKNYRENWLLKWGCLAFLFMLLFAFVVEGLGIEHKQYTITDAIDREDFVLYGLIGVFIIPIIEEIAFRGVLLNTKWKKIVAWLFLGGFIFAMRSTISGVGYFSLVLFIVLCFIWTKKGRPENIWFKLVLISNAIMFGGIHYSMSDFEIFDFYLVVQYISFSVGIFILLWFFVNFKLTGSILCHFCWNALAFGLTLLSAHIPDDDNVYRVENSKLSMEWQQTSLFGDRVFYSRHHNDTLIYKIHTPEELVAPVNDEARALRAGYFPTEANRFYNFTVVVKDTSLQFRSEAYNRQVYELLEEAELVVKKADKARKLYIRGR